MFSNFLHLKPEDITDIFNRNNLLNLAYLRACISKYSNNEQES